MSSEKHSGPIAPTLLHHVAIETTDLDNCEKWYREFLNFQPAWTLTEFSELTLSRLPGISRLTEVTCGGARLHLFERDGVHAEPTPARAPVQHLCLSFPAVALLETARSRWLELFESGRFSFAKGEEPSPLVTDSDGVVSFYAYDVNGLELELTYDPSLHAAR
ncbi:VOC family protein [Streptomyces sp. NPDC050619]|uniref:VOC family protein n=1 Tax=Streptomyces sp. NPDC050619 TaxID=3157214 RepID=UPI0034471346